MEPWRGAMLLAAADLEGDPVPDLAEDIIEQLEERLAFEAWADTRTTD